ncbi:mandelate racemase/muconate lactonizing enzyme family protein [Saccharopolyspora phatthalungensis]|uniref:L-alanine-DL-glutamate epimerase-like enolase superfamily enzyme n=1 Tax=Saccharopolyspora phatthalungensis TaxID=664693 RepID=A0A840QIA6_9PSEU|nr:enolase C-terminal domain-like protein [Saccharopolyspora phatthalungensis]MBB5158305.1 L-alanine-DL-glutamate epimerase-like enolase superfamily enzyme [Saccharopolyspora phatthalungensis]
MTPAESTAPAVIGAWYAVVRLPLRVRLRHSTADVGELQEVVFQVRLADGSTGWAEMRGNGAYATGCDTTSITAALAALPAAGDPRWADVAGLTTALTGRCRLAAAGLDIAWRDARARSEGRRLCASLSGDTELPDRLPTHAAIGFCAPQEAHAQAVAAAEAGFSRIKIRVGCDLDRERLRTIRRAADRVAGDGAVALAADANGAWDAAEAIEATAWLADCGVAWLEQPVAPGDIGELARVRAAARVPIWADESARDEASVAALAAADAVDGVHLKLEKTGTVTALAAAITRARATGLQVGLGQMDCGRLGCAATAHLAAGLRVQVAELWGCANVARDITAGLQLQGGSVLLPPGPGLGTQPLPPPEMTPVGTPLAVPA